MITKFLIYLTIFSAPLYLVRFSLFNFPTNFLDILIIFTTLAWLTKNNFKFNFQFSKYYFLIFLILFGLIISAIASGNNIHSWGIIKSWFILPIIFGWIVKQEFKNADNKLTILNTIFYSTIVVAVISVIYYFLNITTYDHRLRSFFLSPNQLAMYLELGFIIGIWNLIFNTKQYENRPRDIISLINIAGCLLLATVLFLTYSQGAWLALTFVFGVLYFMFHKKTKTLILILSAFFIVLTLFSNQLDIPNTRYKILDTENSFSSRLIIWQSAIKIAKDHWFLGIGAGNFQNQYLVYQKYFSPYQEWAVPQPHNIYLAFWLQAGLFGILGFIGLMLAYCQKLFSKIKTARNSNQKKLALILLTLIFVILTHGLVDTPVWKNDLALIFWTIVLIL